MNQNQSESHQEMSLVNVDRTSELRFLAHRLAKDHDLLKKEARERFHFRRCLVAGSPTRRLRKCVEGIQRTSMKEFSLGGDFSLETLRK